MMYNPLFVLLQPQKWYTFGLQFGTLWHYYLHLITDTAHYTTVLDLAMKAKHSLWIGTADMGI